MKNAVVKVLSSILLLAACGVAHAEDEFVVEKSNPVVYELQAGTDNNVMTYTTGTVHGDLTLKRYGANTGALGIDLTTLALGPDEGDSPAVWLYNESYTQPRCRIEVSDTATVGENGGWATFVIEGGSFSVLKSLVIGAAAGVPDDGLFVTIKKGLHLLGQLDLFKFTNNSAKGVKIAFDNGEIRARGGGGARIFNPVAGDIVLSSLNGNDINIKNPNGYTPFCLFDESATYSGKLRTEGTGDFVVEYGTASSADVKLLDMDTQMKSTMVWGHSGDFVLKNHSAQLKDLNVLPANETVGVIRLSGTDPAHPSILKMWSCSQVVNGIKVADGEYGSIIADAGAVLTLGRYKDGELTNVNLGDKVKIVQEGHVVSFACESVSNYELRSGTLKIKNSATFGTLKLSEGVTVDIAEGAVLNVGSLDDGGAVFTGKGGLGIKEGCAYLETPRGVRTVKSGEGTFLYNQKVPLGDVEVSGGTLKLAGVGSTNEYWRVTVNESGYRMNLAAIGLFAGDTLNSVLDGYDYSQATVVDGLAKGQIHYDTAKYVIDATGVKTGVSGNDPVTFSDDAAVLLDSDPKTGMTLKLNNGDPKGIAFTFRRAEGDVVPVTAYSLRYPINAVQATHAYSARAPNKYVFETSVDGASWITVGEVSGRGDGTWGSWTDNRSFPLELAAGVPVTGGKGLVADAKVRVADGAVLDLTDSTSGNVISQLEIDATGDNGTVLGAALASAGTVVIKNFTTESALREVKLLSFPTLTANISKWSVVTEDGRRLKFHFAVRDGVMSVERNGMLLMFR